jgi:hypothetical protein
VQLQYDPQAFPSGIPNITALISGKIVYDPRSATTAYSNNAALCSADFLADQRLGLAVPWAKINTPTLTTAANTCDELVALAAGGTEKRYTCNGVLNIDTSDRNQIQALASAKGAPTVSNMGIWYVYAGAYRLPTLSLDEGDTVSALRVSTRNPRSSLYNSVKGVYVSPVNDWQLSDFPADQVQPSVR